MRIVKLGGSLLGYRRLAEALRNWWATQPAAHNVVVVGGGAMVDAIRLVDARQSLGELNCHWMSIQAMGIAARYVSERLPEVPLVVWADQPGHYGSALHGQVSICLLDVEHFLKHVEPTAAGTRLEATWRVSSDSIAARLAVVLQARELVLLKSTLPPDGVCLRSHQRSDFVDPFFAKLAGDLPTVRAVNLRDATFPSRHW